MKKTRTSTVALALAGGAMATVMAAGSASAADIPGFVSKVKVGGGTRTVYSGHTELNRTDLKGCASNAWVEGHVTWTLGSVSKSSIVVKKIQVTRTATPQFADSGVLFDVVARGPHDVWAVGWSRDTDKQRPAGLALHWDGTAWSDVPLPAGTYALQAAALRPHGGLAVVGGVDDGAVGLSWTPTGGWQSLGLPENDPQLPLGVSAVAAHGPHLTIAGWHYHPGDGGDSFDSGTILTR
jgi:hypothetical protein